MKAEIGRPKTLQDAKYNRQRWNPLPGDVGYYLHLSDLRIALQPFATDSSLTILDYGCGGSPYRALFPHANYCRADIGPSDDLDYELDATGSIHAPSAMFDLILSTQVVEHVKDPAHYFAECFRLLKNGGELICTTHGAFEDHGCPFDYQRWTTYGLQRDLEAAGFQVTGVSKLTTGPRALIFLIDRGWLWGPVKGVLGMALFLVRSFFKLFRSWIHRMCDITLVDHRVVRDKLDDHPLYVGVLIVGTKVAE
ncbi:MAG: class I SAM-dependent methyltransferase [Caldilineaceae bacterium]|nr:class I SAM-dependent methyltransferase [Caldilineaceae bacterium]